MDATQIAAELLEPVPANATLGIRVVRAHNGFGEVGLDVHPALGNVIGSLHSSGLVGLIDASCLAAMIAAADNRRQLNGFVPLGSRTEIEFRAPAGAGW